MATCEDAEDLCLDMIDGAWPGVLAEVVLAAYAFVGIAVVADEHLAPGLETLCRQAQPGRGAWLSFLALGSAAPEIIISAVSTVKSIITMDDDARKKGGGDGPSEASAFATSLGVSSIIGSGMMAFTPDPGPLRHGGAPADEAQAAPPRPRCLLLHPLALPPVRGHPGWRGQLARCCDHGRPICCLPQLDGGRAGDPRMVPRQRRREGAALDGRGEGRPRREPRIRRRTRATTTTRRSPGRLPRPSSCPSLPSRPSSA